MHFLKPFLLLFSLFFILSFSGAAERKEPVAISDTLHTNYLSPANVPSPDSIINFGKLFLNTPYRYGSPGTSSFDCSGFTSYVYRNFGYNLKRSSAEQAEQFEPVQPEELKTGDLVYFSGRSRSKRVGHVGIVVSKNDNGTFDFIHAAVRKGVTISNSDEAYYSKRFVKANRVVGFDPFSVVRSAATDNISSNLNEEPIAPIVNNSNVQRIKKRIPAEYHRVKRGETLSSIAQKYGMSIAELKEKNRIKGSKLSLKQQLKVKDEENLMVIEPAKVLAENTKSELQAAKKQQTAENASPVHTVKSGETLFSIAKANNTTVAELKKLNDLSNGKIRLGQELKLSQAEVAPTTIAANKVEANPISYKVKRGETLSSISKKYNITEEELKASNNLKSNTLRSGQNLQIAQVATPASAVPSNKAELEAKSVSYKVKKGETLSSISKKYHITEDELKAMNNLKSSAIRFGQELKVNQPLEVASVNNGSKNTKADPVVATYKVKKGETLSDIAEKNNVSVADIKSLNNLHSSSIRPGQQLQLVSKDVQPEQEAIAKTEKTIVHKVESGESLYLIAKKYNVAIDELKRLNNLDGAKLKPGQSLSINALVESSNSTAEKKTVKPKITHKVKSGESFYSLAKKYGCSVNDIKEWNSKPDNKLNPGDKIIIYSRNS
ncbi:MAG: LysM peptidoglycan-binding domain-containing protein [Paludibacter sp.]|nr:LysM peptidoglycan-binding domain-containing protein [Paludibacter sp.]